MEGAEVDSLELILFLPSLAFLFVSVSWESSQIKDGKLPSHLELPYVNYTSMSGSQSLPLRVDRERRRRRAQRRSKLTISPFSSSLTSPTHRLGFIPSKPDHKTLFFR